MATKLLWGQSKWKGGDNVTTWPSHAAQNPPYGTALRYPETSAQRPSVIRNPTSQRNPTSHHDPTGQQGQTTTMTNTTSWTARIGQHELDSTNWTARTGQHELDSTN
jgi:hypothetical protein